jgi:hypothetical protein
VAPDRSKAGGNRNRPDVLTDPRAIQRVHLDHHQISSHQNVVKTIKDTPITDLADVEVDKTSDDFAAGQSLVWGGDSWIAGDPEVLIPVKAAEEMTKGTPVYVSGEQASGKPIVSKADSDGTGTYPAIGLLLTDLAAGAEGHAVGGGIISGLDTDSYAVGDALYLSSSPGVLTNTRPTATNEKVQKVAVVARSHASAGTVIVMGAGRTNDIPNDLVTLTGVSLGDSDLGTFTGTTIADNETIKGALQDLETAVEAGGGVKYHGRYDTEAETARSGATTTTEIYYTARPDGDGYAESEVDDGGLGAGESSRRRLYYSDKFDADPDTSGDWTLYTTQPADNTAFATAKASLLAGLSDTDGTANTRGTLPVSLKMERTVVTPLLLDTYSGAAAAYSVRLLRTAYSGNAIRIREDSGNTETDIGFDGDGNLDTAAIASHCGSANGYVVTWYDQSGNNIDATQSTTADQPKRYDGATTATLLENGKPAPLFSGSQYLESSSTLTATLNSETIFTVCAANSTSFEMTAVVRYQGSGARRIYQPHYRTNPDIVLSWANTANYTYQSSLDTDQHLFTAYGGNPTSYAYMDGSGGTMTTQTGSNTSVVTIGAFQGGAAFDWRGTIQEHVVWHSDQHANRTGIEGNVNTYFSIYP